MQFLILEIERQGFFIRLKKNLISLRLNKINVDHYGIEDNDKHIILKRFIVKKQ